MISETFKTEAEARKAILRAQGENRTGYVLKYRDDFFEVRHWPVHGSNLRPAILIA